MNIDFAYCLDEGDCIHRRGCKRWIGNYTDEEAKELADSGRDVYVDDEDCMREDYEHDNVKHAFYMLMRFRSSTGEEI